MKSKIMDYLKLQMSIIKTHKKNAFFLLGAVFMSLVCLVASVLHYTHKAYGNHLTWIGWLAGMILLLLAFLPKASSLPGRIFGRLKAINKKRTCIYILLIILFFASHLLNFKTAPWNQNGLFDDASWNIFEAKEFIFSSEPFQGAFWRDGSSSAKGVIFHYYITILFMVFGYNTLVFNLAVMLLAFFTYFFTIKLLYRLFNNHFITIISAVILNFLPLQFLFSFVGQRYAMAPPTLMASLYFLYTGFKNKSFMRISLSSVFAGLCFSAAIMGKQYLMGLAIAIPLFLLFDFKKSFNRVNINLAKCFIVGFIISSMPMLMYMAHNPRYFTLEREYSKAFLDAFFSQGFAGIQEQIDRFYGCLFNSSTFYYRWFIPDYVLIPFSYYAFLIPGTIAAFIKKRFEYLTICMISSVGAFVAGFSDYRLLMISPLWIVLMAFGMHYMIDAAKLFFNPSSISLKEKNKFIETQSKHKDLYKYISYTVITAVILVSLIPCISYLNKKSKDPYSVYFFTQKDVAVSRYLRDIVMGTPDPQPVMRWQEFKTPFVYKKPDYETLICIEYGYAVPFTFLQDFDAKKILSFGGAAGLPFNLISEQELFYANKTAIVNYIPSNKNLKLIWEKTPKSEHIIEKFTSLNYLGHDEYLTSSHEGKSFTFYVLTIYNQNIEQLKNEVLDIEL